MSKDSYYFSHDYNARSDPKIKRLIRAHGVTGYGIFWAIIEDLYNNANALPTDYDGIAFDLRVECEMVKSIVTGFDLFQVSPDFFSSASVQRRLDERQHRSKTASESANFRWNKSKRNANAMQTHSEGNAIKESKGEEIKVKEIKGDIETAFRSRFEKSESFNRAKMEASRQGIKDTAFEIVYRKWLLWFIENNDDFLDAAMVKLESSLKRWIMNEKDFNPAKKKSINPALIP